MPQTPPRGRNNAGVKHKLLSYWNLISNSNRQLVRMIPPHSKVLDIGCSDGQMGRCLREEKGCIVWGMEMDPRRADKAKPVLDRVIVGDAMDSRTWESIHARFDVIALADVLEHMDNPRGFLSALVPWLEPNGVIVLSLPNAGHWSVRRALAGGKPPGQDLGILDRTHRQFHSVKMWKRLCQEAGHKIVRWDCTFNNNDARWLKGLHRYSMANALLLPIERLLAVTCPSLFAYQALLVLKPKHLA